MTEFLSLSESVRKYVKPGQTVAMEGFTHLIPHAASQEVIRLEIRGSTLIRMTPDILYDQMSGMGCASKLMFSWRGNPGVGSPCRLSPLYFPGAKKLIDNDVEGVFEPHLKLRSAG